MLFIVGRIIEFLIKSIGFVLVFWLLTYLTITLVQSLLYDYDIFHTEDTPAIVTEKFSKKSLTAGPSYYVIVDLNDGDHYNEIENRVFAWQFKRLSVGEEIKGHYIHGEHFFTTLDIVKDSLLIIFLLCLMLFFYLALFIWPIEALVKFWKKPPSYTQMRKRRKQNKKSKRVEKQSVFKRILPKKVYDFYSTWLLEDAFLLVFCVVVLSLTGGFAINGFQKLLPIGKTTAEAIVTDKNAESEIYYYIGNVSDPYFSLDLAFTDKEGNSYRVIKEVTKSVYEKHGIGDAVTITHSTHNPYNIFVSDSFWLNVLQMFGYAKFNFYLVILFILFIYYGLRIFNRENR